MIRQLNLPDIFSMEEEKEPVFFWPVITFSGDVLLSAPQKVLQLRDRVGVGAVFDYNPVPPPDRIHRQFRSAQTDSDGAIYEGEIDEDGRRDGRGIILYPEGILYEGYFARGKRNGRGL